MKNQETNRVFFQHAKNVCVMEHEQTAVCGEKELLPDGIRSAITTGKDIGEEVERQGSSYNIITVIYSTAICSQQTAICLQKGMEQTTSKTISLIESSYLNEDESFSAFPGTLLADTNIFYVLITHMKLVREYYEYTRGIAYNDERIEFGTVFGHNYVRHPSFTKVFKDTLS